MTRHLAFNKDMERFGMARDYNKALQEEKDAHLETRLERDRWYVEALKRIEQLRTAYRLRCEEEDGINGPTYLIAGLQNEVRGYRNALGMPVEKFEEEFGYPWLKHVKNGAGEP